MAIADDEEAALDDNELDDEGEEVVAVRSTLLAVEARVLSLRCVFTVKSVLVSGTKCRAKCPQHNTQLVVVVGLSKKGPRSLLDDQWQPGQADSGVIQGRKYRGVSVPRPRAALLACLLLGS